MPHSNRASLHGSIRAIRCQRKFQASVQSRAMRLAMQSGGQLKIRQQGLSLIEMMVAMVLGLILTAGVLQIFISQKSTYSDQAALSEVQENARFALDAISSDAREAGLTTCSSATNVANTLDGATGNEADIGKGLRGYEGGVSTFPADMTNPWPNTDAVRIFTMDGDSSLFVTKHNANAATIHLGKSHSIKPGTVLMIVDSSCSNIGVFMYTGPTNNANNAKIADHNTGNTHNGVSNCTKALKGNFTCGNMAGQLKQPYSNGSSVYSLQTTSYYIGRSANDATVPVLYRIDSTGTREEVVEGIEDLQLSYGLPTGNTLQFRTANTLSTDDWKAVLAVRIELVSRSIQTANQQFIRRNFSTTVNIRNRGGL